MSVLSPRGIFVPSAGILSVTYPSGRIQYRPRDLKSVLPGSNNMLARYVGGVVYLFFKREISLTPLGYSSTCVLKILDSRLDSGGTETSQVPR